MIKANIQSEQLYDCSEQFEQKNHSISAQKKTNPCQSDFRHRFRDPARFSDRTLHSLWKVRMQVCGWTWPWPQILFIRQPTWPKTGAGLCASKIRRTSKTVPGQLSESKTTLRRDLQHKSRTLTKESKAVKDLDGYHCRPLNPRRYRGCRYFSYQHAPGLFGRSFKRNLSEGGKQ